jgi:hypothetical protein
MFTKSRSAITAMLLAVALAITFSITCASKKAAWGDPQTGLIMSYRMPIDQTMKYRTNSAFDQNLEIMGQEVGITSDSHIGFTITPVAQESDNLTLDVLIDTLSMTITNPQGSNSPDVNNVLGKSFSMHLKRNGKEYDIQGADSIRYGLGTEFEASVSTWFQAHFPDLPQGPVVINDSWASADTVSETTPRANIMLIFNNQNILSGFEKIGEHDCAVVTNDFTGSFSGEAVEGEMNLAFDGDIEGTETYYFDYKRGQYLKGASEGRVTGTIKGSGPMEMTIPMTRTFSLSTELVE